MADLKTSVEVTALLAWKASNTTPCTGPDSADQAARPAVLPAPERAAATPAASVAPAAIASRKAVMPAPSLLSDTP